MSARIFSPLFEEAGGGAAAGGGAGGASAAAQAGASGGAAAGGAAAGGAAAGGAAAAGAAAATPPPFFKGLYGDDGKLDKTAFDRLPDHLKPHKDLFSKYETVDAMLAGFGSAHSMAVKKALAPLVGNEPPEVVAERKAMLDTINNVPKDLKGYGITRPEDFPKEFWNDERAGEFAKLAQKHSISPAAVKDLLALQINGTKAELEEARANDERFFAEQGRKWEGAVQKEGVDIEKANEAVLRGAATAGVSKDSPLLKNSEFRVAMLRLTQLVSEDRLVNGNAAGGATTSARDQARDIMSNPQNPLHKAWSDSAHPQHEMAKERVNALYRTHKG